MSGDVRIHAYQVRGNLVLSDQDTVSEAQATQRYILVEDLPEVVG